MTQPDASQRTQTPRHLWLVGVLALIWNGGGAFDYLMTATRDAEYMSSFTPEQLAYFYDFPSWVVATWALSVWGGVLGALLLLARSRLALQVFGLSLLTMAITFFHNYVLTDGIAVSGGVAGLVFTAVIVAIAIFLFLYAMRLTKKRILV
jgi:hypothetical protein